MYRYEVTHGGLNKFQVVRGQTPAEAKLRAELKIAAWNEQYRRLLEREQKRVAFWGERAAKGLQKEEAAERTKEAEEAINLLKNLLQHAVNEVQPFDPESLRLVDGFTEEKPPAPKVKSYSVEPKFENMKYVVDIFFLDRIFKARLARKIVNSTALFERDHSEWTEACAAIDKYNQNLRGKYESDLANWTANKELHESSQVETNSQLDELIGGYWSSQSTSVSNYFGMVLRVVNFRIFSPAITSCFMMKALKL
jgi:restriction system protein